MSDTESVDSISTVIFEPDSSNKTKIRDVHSSLEPREYRDARSFVRPTIREQKAREEEERRKIENDLTIENLSDLEDSYSEEPVSKEEMDKAKDKAVAEIDKNLEDPVAKKVKNVKLSNRRECSTSTQDAESSRRQNESSDDAEVLFQEEMNRMINPPKPGEKGYVNLDLPLPGSTTQTYQVETKSAYARKIDELKMRQQQKALDRQNARIEEVMQNEKRRKEKVTFTKVVPISIPISENVFENSNHMGNRMENRGRKKTTKSAPSKNVVYTRVYPLRQNDGGPFTRIRNGVARFGRFIGKQIRKLSCVSS